MNHPGMATPRGRAAPYPATTQVARDLPDNPNPGRPTRTPRCIIAPGRASMTSRAPNSPDEAVRRAWEAGDADAAITAVLEHYGPEILGWLVGIFRDADDA